MVCAIRDRTGLVVSTHAWLQTRQSPVRDPHVATRLLRNRNQQVSSETMEWLQNRRHEAQTEPNRT